MARVPKWIRAWKLNPAWRAAQEPTLETIKIDRYLTGGILPIRKVARAHRAAYRDTLARLALAAHRTGHYGPGKPKGKVPLSSSYRTRAQQKRLYAAYEAGTGALAARPGTSMHELGLAVDVPNVRATHPLIDECRKLGLIDDVASEKWHLTNHAYRA